MPIVPLYGHDDLRKRLAARARRGGLPRSLLFHGPAGVGKQRLALWLAQTLVCSGAESGGPCGDCAACRLAADLGHPDIHWFFPRPRLKDGDRDRDDVLADYAEALNARRAAKGLYSRPSGSDAIYIATVRAIVQIAALSPVVANRKIFIVGDGERMVPQEGSDQAANAFLKLLEEPPENTTIIVTSSESGALLPTLRSRMVAVRVARLGSAEVRSFLVDPEVEAYLERTENRVALRRAIERSGAPGDLLADGHRGAAGGDAARRLLASAERRDRAAMAQLALAQGSSRARGAFSDTMASLTSELSGRAHDAAGRGDAPAVEAACRAITLVEEAREKATVNVNPSLVTAGLLANLSEVL